MQLMSGTWKLPAVDGDSGQYSRALIGRYRVTPEVAGNAVKNFRFIHVHGVLAPVPEQSSTNSKVRAQVPMMQPELARSDRIDQDRTVALFLVYRRVKQQARTSLIPFKKFVLSQ
jgi:hypothetical protein